MFYLFIQLRQYQKLSSLRGFVNLLAWNTGHTKAGYHGDMMSVRPSTILWEPVSVRKKLGTALALPAGGVRGSETIGAVDWNGWRWFA
jgi:hypothetical protein